MESPIAAQAIFVGRRGNFTLQGEFQGEPDWERLAGEEGGSLLRVVRDCHLPSSQPPRDWVSLGGEICLPSHEPTESFGLGEVRRGRRTWFQEFALLPLSSEQGLVNFARQHGVPAELPKIHGDLGLFCPVMRFQYDVSMLRALLRVVGELRRPRPDEATLDAQVRLLQLLWQDPRRSWISVGDKTDYDYPDYPSEERVSDQPGEWDSFPLYLQTWVLQEQRPGAPSPILERAVGALGIGFWRVLSNCSPIVDVWLDSRGRPQLRPSYIPRHEVTRLRDFLYLQAWEELPRSLVGECGCGCRTLFFLSPHQQTIWNRGEQVFLRAHQGRRRRTPPGSEQEAAARRARETERRRRYRQIRREQQIAAGHLPRPRGRPRRTG